MPETNVIQETVLQELQKAIAESPVIKAAKDNKNRISGRNLTQDEIDALKRNGNYSCDWTKITVAQNFIPDNIYNCYLAGETYIGIMSGYKEIDGKTIWFGLAASMICSCEILDDVTIVDAKNLCGYRVHSGANIFNTGTLAMKGASSFGIGSELPIAIETGGREVLIYPEITIEIASKIATSRKNKELISQYNELVEKYKAEASSDRGTICSNAVISNCPKIINAYIGEGAHIDNATLIQDATIYSLTNEKTEISDGAYVKKAIIQWGTEVTSMAIVTNSALTEHSHVERHGKVTDSIIGPNTGIAEGEVTACLVGPFVGFHHQSLLIAAYWPEGKGNIGYGANVGSNHTSKAPDQELWAGEGLFYGLGVNIKFPSDYSKAPYSIIATGVSALPQRMEFPFSLMNTPATSYPNISPAYNELMPGWVLSDNIYTIKRNEGKYIKRNKAKRSKLVFEVFRPEIVDLMVSARKRLQSACGKEVYTRKEVKGLGKSYMTEQSRVSAIEAYTFYIQYYALCGLKKMVKELDGSGRIGEAKSLLSQSAASFNGCSRWDHEKNVLLQELTGKSVADCLNILSGMEQKIAECVQESKEKDDKRGASIIPDYSEAHSPASEDGFVKETWKKTKEIQEEIKNLIAKL